MQTASVRLIPNGKVARDYAKHTINVDATLRQQQQRTIQRHTIEMLVEFQITHPNEGAQHRQRCQHIQQHFGDGYLECCQHAVHRHFAQHIKHDQRYDGQHDDQNAGEHAVMRSRTIHRKVMGILCGCRYLSVTCTLWLLCAHRLLPHFEQNDGTNQRILNGARE